MPRLRYRKNYDLTFEEQDCEAASGNSWLSNISIASQLSDERIKQAIKALRNQVNCLEAELLSRSVGNRNPPKLNNTQDCYTRPKRTGEKKRRSATCAQFQKLASLRATLAKLGVNDVDALLKEWSQLNEKGAKSDT